MTPLLSTSLIPNLPSMTTRLPLGIIIRERSEETTDTPFWTGALPWQATPAVPNDIGAKVWACTPRRSRTGRGGGESYLALPAKHLANNGPERRSADVR